MSAPFNDIAAVLMALLLIGLGMYRYDQRAPGYRWWLLPVVVGVLVLVVIL